MAVIREAEPYRCGILMSGHQSCIHMYVPISQPSFSSDVPMRSESWVAMGLMAWYGCRMWCRSVGEGCGGKWFVVGGGFVHQVHRKLRHSLMTYSSFPALQPTTVKNNIFSGLLAKLPSPTPLSLHSTCRSNPSLTAKA